MKLPRKGMSKARIEMIPLLDIVFLLLVFFIYAMLSMSVHRSLPVNLPESDQAGIDRDRKLSVTLRADGTVFLDKKPVEVDELTQMLTRAASEQVSAKADGKTAANGPGAKSAAEIGVDFFAAETVPYQEIFRIMDRITAAGINKISLQAVSSDGAEEADPAK